MRPGALDLCQVTASPRTACAANQLDSPGLPSTAWRLEAYGHEVPNIFGRSGLLMPKITSRICPLFVRNAQHCSHAATKPRRPLDGGCRPIERGWCRESRRSRGAATLPGDGSLRHPRITRPASAIRRRALAELCGSAAPSPARDRRGPFHRRADPRRRIFRGARHARCPLPRRPSRARSCPAAAAA